MNVRFHFFGAAVLFGSSVVCGTPAVQAQCGCGYQIVNKVVYDQVPVTTYRPAQNEYVTAVAVGPSSSNLGAAGATSVASRPIGGQQLQSDPPKQNTWNTGTAYR